MFSSIDEVIERFSQEQLHRQPPNRDRCLSGKRDAKADTGGRTGGCR